jgi:hypothetical protein
VLHTGHSYPWLFSRFVLERGGRFRQGTASAVPQESFFPSRLQPLRQPFEPRQCKKLSSHGNTDSSSFTAACHGSTLALLTDTTVQASLVVAACLQFSRAFLRASSVVICATDMPNECSDVANALCGPSSK